MYGTTQFAVTVHALTSIAVLTEVDGRPSVASDTLARSIATHPVLVRRLLAPLVDAGLVGVTRGKGGGFTLGRRAATITLADVLDALGDDPPFPFHPKEGNPLCLVSRGLRGALAPRLDAATAALRRELARTTLGDLAAELTAEFTTRPQERDTP